MLAWALEMTNIQSISRTLLYYTYSSDKFRTLLIHLEKQCKFEGCLHSFIFAFEKTFITNSLQDSLLKLDQLS